MDQAHSTTFENNLNNVPNRQFFNVFIVPQNDCGAVFGYVSHDNSIKKKLGILGDESLNVYMPHKTQYAIGILNISTHPAEASVRIDGKFIGLFYLDAYKYIEIKRSPYEDKSFVFTSICENSPDANFARENINPQFRGEVRVDIRPRDQSVNLYEQCQVILQPSGSALEPYYNIKNGAGKNRPRKQPDPKHVTRVFPNRFRKCGPPSTCDN